MQVRWFERQGSRRTQSKEIKWKSKNIHGGRKKKSNKNITRTSLIIQRIYPIQNYCAHYHLLSKVLLLTESIFLLEQQHGCFPSC